MLGYALLDMRPSKICTTEDLQRISTFGFRGEALASIASVAHVELRTRSTEDETGIHVFVEKSRIIRQAHVQTPLGSHFAVKNLFFNVPARRKFLRAVSTEMHHITQVFQQAALAHAQVSFVLRTEQSDQSTKELYRLASTTPQQRIVTLLGKKYAKQLLPIEAKHPSLRIHGYVGKPEAAAKKSGHQWFFVNTRYIRSRHLSHAITSAYEELITSDRYPFFLVHIDIDPLQVDVNIHPNKTEVKFEDEQNDLCATSVCCKEELIELPRRRRYGLRCGH